MSAILNNDKMQTMFPLYDAVISEAPWQCAFVTPARSPASTDQRCRTSILVDWLIGLQAKMASTRFKSGQLGRASGLICRSQVCDRVSRNLRWHTVTVLLRSSFVAPSIVLHFIMIKLASCHFRPTCCFMHVVHMSQKSLNFVVQLLQVKMKVSPV